MNFVCRHFCAICIGIIHLVCKSPPSPRQHNILLIHKKIYLNQNKISREGEIVLEFYWGVQYSGVLIPPRWGLSSVGRASDLHSEGQEFDSPSLHNSAVIAQLVRAQH